MEIEAKFRALTPLEPAQIGALDVRPFALAAAEAATHEDVLLDTPDERVTGAGHALRIRSSGGTHWLTLKSDGQVTGATHRREEVECPLDAELAQPPYQPERWPAPIGSRMATLVGDAPLEPVTHNHMHRVTWAVLRDGVEIAEIAYDTGYIEAKALRDRVHEVEVELKGDGAEADLTAITAVLAAELPLAPEARTKLQRGMALRAQEAPLPDLLLTDLVAYLCRRQLKRVADLHGDAPSEDDIHDARVGIRRTRLALQVAADFLPERQDELARLRRRLRRLSRALGVVRDLDVAAGLLHGMPELDAALTSRIAGRLMARRGEAVAHLRDVRHASRTKAALDTLMETEPPCEGPTALQCAGTVVWTAYERVLAGEAALASGESVRAHLVRKDCRELRYKAELLAPALGSATRPLIKRLTRFQDYLGHLQDLAMTSSLLAQDGDEDSEVRSSTLEALAQAQRRERARMSAMWQLVAGPVFRRRLAALIAGMTT
ncbi:MAG TPA: CHAD domain-containing protein [Ktedonobacterales bacterium]